MNENTKKVKEVLFLHAFSGSWNTSIVILCCYDILKLTHIESLKNLGTLKMLNVFVCYICFTLGVSYLINLYIRLLLTSYNSR